LKENLFDPGLDIKIGVVWQVKLLVREVYLK